MTYLARRPPVIRRKPGMGDDLFDIGALFDAVSADQAPPADNVNQTTGGGTTTSASDFTSVSGVCKPQNFPALQAVQEFQRQLNRVAQVKGLGKIGVDGAVGPKTVALFKSVQSIGAGSIMGDASSCMGIAPDVDVLAAQIRDLADTLGAPATVSGPISIMPATIVTKSGKTVVAPDAGIIGSLATLGSVEKVALLGIVGGIGYILLNKKKTTKRRR